MAAPSLVSSIQIGAAVIAGGLALMMHGWFMGIEHPRRRLLTLATWVGLAWAASLPGIVMRVLPPLPALSATALGAAFMLAMVELRIWLNHVQSEGRARSAAEWRAKSRARYRATDFGGDAPP